MSRNHENLQVFHQAHRLTRAIARRSQSRAISWKEVLEVASVTI
jgi:hypothetical protein